MKILPIDYDERSKVGLKVSDEKTKSVLIMETSNNKLSIQNKQIEDVDALAYLGSIVSTEGGAEEDIKHRLCKAMGVFQILQKIWSLTSISMKIKLQLYNISYYQQLSMLVKPGNLLQLFERS